MAERGTFSHCNWMMIRLVRCPANRAAVRPGRSDGAGKRRAEIGKSVPRNSRQRSQEQLFFLYNQTLSVSGRGFICTISRH
jgi:hypothetical protein